MTTAHWHAGEDTSGTASCEDGAVEAVTFSCCSLDGARHPLWLLLLDPDGHVGSLGGT